MSETTDESLTWHFLPDDGMTRFSPRIKAAVGQTLTEERPLEMCAIGLHASERALDALQYAPGSLVCWVRLSGQILRQYDKCCASKRTVLAMGDATGLLHEFACWCAEEALLRVQAAGREPDLRSWAAIAAKRQWLEGKINAGALSAARVAAWDAAWDAARDAARAAAWAAAAAAARSAAGDAARDAARAAGAAAGAAARDAARIEQNAELEQRLCRLLEIRGK